QILRLTTCDRALPTIQRAGCLELFIREIPSSAERLVELDNDQTAVDLRLRQRQLRGIESLQGVENFDVAGQPFHVTHPGKPDRCQVFLYRLSLLGADVIVILARNERVGDIAESAQGRLQILSSCFLPASDRLPLLSLKTAEVEDWSCDWRSNAPGVRVAGAEFAEWRAQFTEECREADCWKEYRLCNSDLRVRRPHCLRGREHVGPPLQQSRRQARWDIG